jgi:hypothetical protein
MTDITLSVDGLHPKAEVSARDFPDPKECNPFVELIIHADFSSIKMFFPDKSALYRFANQVTRAACNITEVNPQKDNGKIEICDKCGTMIIDGKCYCKTDAVGMPA